MNEYESAVAAARVASRENLLAKYRRDLAAALDERDEALVRLSFLKQSEDTTGRALANCLAALDDITAERDELRAEREWYRAAWLEASRERDGLATDLRHCEALVDSLRDECGRFKSSWSEAVRERDGLFKELQREQSRALSLGQKNDQLRNQLAALSLWRDQMSEDFAQVRKQRDDLVAWWQDANGYVEEAGM